MKLTLHFQTILFSLLMSCTFLGAQDYDRQSTSGDWEIGINAGFAFQEGDIRIAPGWGVGLTLGKTLYHKRGGFVDLGLRGRLLYTQTYGRDFVRSTGIENNTVFNGTRADALDYLTDPGYVYQNHQSHIGELSLEGVLTFNRLRERTGVILSLFGGLGIDFYQTNTDQLDLAGERYDYTLIDPTGRRGQVFDELGLLRDFDYETLAEGFEDDIRVSFMPSLGVELGYQVDPVFSVGLGHRWTYALHDQLEGQQWTNDNILTSNNDKYLYTNVWLRWKIKGKEEASYDDPIGQDDPIAPVIPGPVVRITNPAQDPFQTASNQIRIFANIQHVENRGAVTVSVNGNRIGDFTYNANTDQLELFTYLNPGRNVIEITGSNSQGVDSDRIRIDYAEPIIEDPIVTPPPPPVVRNPPRVRITRPSNNTSTYNSQQQVEAQLDYVSSQGDISFYLNGNSVYNFNYNRNSGRLTANVSLQNGQNTIEIVGSNIDGTDRDRVTVRLEQETPQVNPPTVQIIDPVNNYESNVPSYTVRANLTNISSRSGINFRVNGRTINSFEYNANTGRFSANVDLIEGNNSVSILVTNNDGQDSDNVNIVYAVQGQAPTVAIVQPSANPYTSATNSTTVLAAVNGVNSRAEISMRLNGQNFNNFDFNTGTGTLTANINLTPGTNTVVVTATNTYGSDSDDRQILLEASLPRPTVKFTYPAANPYDISKSTITVKADITHVDNRNDVSFTLNGQALNNFSFNASTGLFSANLNLNEGTNVATIQVRNQTGTDQDSRTIMYNLPKPAAPTVTITRPAADPFTTVDQATGIRARITGVTTRGQISMRLNGQVTTNFTYDQANQLLSANVNLAVGNNTVQITASTPGGTDTDQTVIIRSNPIKVPSVVIITPEDDPHTTTLATANIQARITGIESRDQASVRVNGQQISGFSFNTAQNLLTANIPLNPGNNTVVVSATNDAGTDTDQTVIIRNNLIKVPSVLIITPEDDPHTTTFGTANIQARITGIDNRNQASVRVNGQSISGFNFNAAQNLLTANITLSPGNNTVVVSATNDAGTDSDQTVIIQENLIKIPSVVIITPESDPYTTTFETANIQARITAIESRDQASVRVNGQLISTFNYNVAKDLLTANITLRPGNNTVVVSATNIAGSDSDQTQIQYNKPVPPPVVQITTPASNSSSTDQSNTTIRANIKHVTERDNIIFTVNGQSINQFNFNDKTGKFSANLNLAPGLSAIEITGRNNTGIDSDNANITYRPPLKPTVVITVPQSSPQTTTEATENVRADLSNVTSSSQVRVVVNKQTITNFFFNASTGRLNLNVNLQEGNNKITITATTNGGTASANTTIIYQPPVSPPNPDPSGNGSTPSGGGSQDPAPASAPTVRFSGGETVYSASSSYNFTATVSSVRSTSGIEVKVNGKTTSGVSLDGKSGLISKAVPLREGVNKIRVKATNAKGSKSKNLTVIYSAEKNAPKIFWVSPGNKSTKSGNPNLRAAVVNARSKADITVKVNGSAVSNFSYNKNNKVLSFKTALNAGSNTVQITVNNGKGTKTETYTITRR